MDVFGCLTLLALAVGCYLLYQIALLRQERKAQRQKWEAQQKYQEALGLLKFDPTNPNLRQKTLELGRYYSNLTRDGQGVTVYDEVSLMNDINAATAGALSSLRSNQDHTSQQSPEERLEKLRELKSLGLINEEEYTAKRKQILDAM